MKSEELKSFSDELRAVMQKKNLTRPMVIQILNGWCNSLSTVDHWLSGKRCPSAAKQKLVLKLLDEVKKNT